MSALLILSMVIAVLAAAGGGLYTAGELDSIIEWVAKKYFRAKAKAEEKALEKAGSDEAKSFLKGSLKENPAVSNDELNQISSGLGDEAAKEFGNFGKKF